MARNPKEQKLPVATRHVAKKSKGDPTAHAGQALGQPARHAGQTKREKKIDADSAPTSDITVADPMSTRYSPLRLLEIGLMCWWFTRSGCLRVREDHTINHYNYI